MVVHAIELDILNEAILHVSPSQVVHLLLGLEAGVVRTDKLVDRGIERG